MCLKKNQLKCFHNGFDLGAHGKNRISPTQEGTGKGKEKSKPWYISWMLKDSVQLKMEKVAVKVPPICANVEWW